MSNPCPCGSQRDFATCCEPIIRGKKKAETPEALMRARYTAYTHLDVDFLYDSSTDKVRGEFDREETRHWASESQWHGLEILKTEGGESGDPSGVVEFRARYTVKDRPCNHHERATFIREGKEWKFDDGQILGPEPVRREHPKIGRNDPCPCGSGKKHKKCCAVSVNH